MIWHTNEFFLFLIALGLFSAAIELGFRLGRQYASSHDKALTTHISALQDTILGLLALLIGFTFAMAVERFETRRQMVLAEANSIGTTYLRSQLLPENLPGEAKILLRQYVESRLSFYYAGNDIKKIEEVEGDSLEISKKLWKLAVESAKESDNPIYIGLFLQSLNEVIDNNEKRMVALENHVPQPLVFLLFFVSMCGMSFIGYSYGLTDKRRHGSTVFFALLIAGVLIVILDVDSPRRGMIQVSQASLERLLADISH